jgi:hypothetical protein
MICNMFIYAGYDYVMNGMWPWSYVLNPVKWELWFYVVGVLSVVLLVGTIFVGGR